jgi:hypothetical protein
MPSSSTRWLPDATYGTVTYCTKQAETLDWSLTRYIQDRLSSIENFQASFISTSDYGYVPETLEIAQGQAFYLVGGRISLVNELKYMKGLFKTVDGGIISYAFETGIKFSTKTRIGSALKTTFGKRSRNYDKSTAYNIDQLKQRKLTVVAVYHQDRAGRMEPTTKHKKSIISDELSMSTLSTFLASDFLGVIEDKNVEKSKNLDNVMDQLNW